MLKRHLIQYPRVPKRRATKARRAIKGGELCGGAKNGALTSRLLVIPIAMHGAIGKSGSCTYRELGRGPEPLI